MEFSERFKTLKNERGLTYRDVSRQLGINERAVQYYAQGKRFPDFKGLLLLADFFEVSIDYLVGRSDIPNW